MNGIARLAAFALLLSCGLGAAHAQCINLSAVDTANTQNFDALANSGTSNTLSLAGWSMTETGGGVTYLGPEDHPGTGAAPPGGK